MAAHMAQPQLEFVSPNDLGDDRHGRLLTQRNSGGCQFGDIGRVLVSPNLRIGDMCPDDAESPKAVGLHQQLRYLIKMVGPP